MKLGLRWSLWLLGIVPLLVLIDVAALQWMIRREAGEQELASRERLSAQLEEMLAEQAAIADEALERLTADPQFREWVGSPIELRSWLDQAAEWARSVDADQILLLDRDGRVIVSAIHPESYGLPHPSAEFFGAVLPHAPLLFEDWEGDERPVHLGMSTTLAGQRLIVALRMDRERLSEWAQILRISGLRWREGGGTPTPSDFQLQRVWGLDASGGESAEALALRELARAVLSLQLLLIALAAAVALWLGRRAARPIVELSRAVTSMRGGEAPRLRPAAGGSELERLTRDVAAMAEDLSSAQQQRLEAERRGAWREIAQRIAHEIKNVLSPLGLALDNLETTAGRQDEKARAVTARSLQTAREQLVSLDRLVGEFRSFARIPPPSLRDLEVAALCRAAADALREAFPRQELRILDSPPLHGVRGDGELLRRALGNLLRNAAEASSGGAIDLSWGEGPGSAHWWCAVRDRGPGLPAEILAKLGEPVQSGKASGSGLGLSIVVQTLQAHGGRLLARNLEGGGCELRWELPKRAKGFVIEGEESR